MIQDILTYAIEAIAVGSAIYFGTMFIAGYPAWKRRRTAPEAPMPSIHDFSDDELVNHLVDTLTDAAELPEEPEWFNCETLVNCDSNHQSEQAIASFSDVIVPFARKPKAFVLELMNSQELRKLCSDRGIRWRNAHGKGKHLSKGQMIRALSSASAA